MIAQSPRGFIAQISAETNCLWLTVQQSVREHGFIPCTKGMLWVVGLGRGQGLQVWGAEHLEREKHKSPMGDKFQGTVALTIKDGGISKAGLAAGTPAVTSGKGSKHLQSSSAEDMWMSLGHANAGSTQVAISTRVCDLPAMPWVSSHPSAEGGPFCRQLRHFPHTKDHAYLDRVQRF